MAPICGVFRAPVALLRVSGTGSWVLASKLFECHVPAERRKPRHAYFGNLINSEGEAFDEGILVLFEEGKSYTGEESFEISCHGAPVNVRCTQNRIIQLGARDARPGEFTERAFLNGRIDLTQAEAVRQTIEAQTDIQARQAALLRSGTLQRRIVAIEERLFRVLAEAEATIDFSEEVGELDRSSATKELSDLRAEIEQLLASYSTARIIRNGLKVVLVGRPNVGKSSILNALLGAERAIVTEVPGTTRDTIEELLSIDGYPVVLTDTAGIREVSDTVERIGVERSREAVEQGDEIWFVYEACEGWTNADEALKLTLPKPPTLFIANKADLGAKEGPGLQVCALDRAGFEAIRLHVKRAFVHEGVEPPLVNDRHREELGRAADLMGHAEETLRSDLPTDLACADLSGALEAVGRITGSTASTDIIDRVFQEFCIGK